MATYLVVADFRTRSIMPGADVDYLETNEPGYLLARLTSWTAWIDARLRKRYAVPFVAPYPEIVALWLTNLVTLDAYAKRGFDPATASSADARVIVKPADDAQAEIKEAADAQNGLFDLPLRQDSAASGVTQSAPFASTDASPYAAFDAQVINARAQDYTRRG